MADEGKGGQKTEQPTPKRLRDARKKGKIVKSKEVIDTFLVVGLVIYSYTAMEYMIKHVAALMLSSADVLSLEPPGSYVTLISASVNVMLLILVPILVVVIAVSILAHVVQFGMVFSAEPVKPNLEKINPLSQLKNIFSMKTLVELGKSIVKILILGGFCYYFIRENLVAMLVAPKCGLPCVGSVLGDILLGLLGATIAVYICLAVLDYSYQKFDFTKKMMMSKDEVKREYKETEGDPQIKRERKRLHRELLASAGDLDIKNSSAVVTNPTHYAVALHYQRGVTPLPIVTARGRDKEALRIRGVAERYGIPVIENPPLARQLYRKDRVGDYISRELMAEVAQLLRHVRQNFGSEHLERRQTHRLGPLLSPLNQLYNRLYRPE
jgi:type III secretion protein U